MYVGKQKSHGNVYLLWLPKSWADNTIKFANFLMHGNKMTLSINKIKEIEWGKTFGGKLRQYKIGHLHLHQNDIIMIIMTKWVGTEIPMYVYCFSNHHLRIEE